MPADAAADQAGIDRAIVDPRTYADQAACDALFARLRRERPAHWTAPDSVRPFWTISRHADIKDIERQNDRFINDPRLVLTSIADEERVKRITGGNHLLLRTLVNMDDPDHRVYRNLTQPWFMPPNLKKLEAGLAALAREFVDRLEDMDGECDFVRDVAVWYPLRVIMMILGVPREDEALMLKLTQEIFGARDPDMRRGGDTDEKAHVSATVKEFFSYFGALIADRRKNPKDDVASVIANAQIGGKPISEFEALSYYVIIATAGHDTTSSTTAGGLLALMQNPAELAKLRARPDLLRLAIDEMVRWVTPVKHFFRTATVDHDLHGHTIRAGDSLMMCYASANRDEAVFAEPYAFKVDRAPNPHIAFGYGVHLCLGQHLAKMEIRTLYEELLSRLEHVELAGDPAWVEATFVSGLKRLPIRYRMKRKAA
ncbi:cytochrome P450 [Vineibacter terrae]|uniref:Cytochrome P450 n=1 Tax=Vineibacter terrae TaxID=2586908 RepID=A0A5C8PMG3_9HYPH|nr:cytochrome P450 [Vineibacter terrae]TXL74810.1 cytochrome P450 [Vineibacter terrae]